jgi:RNA polymerase sigma factor (sigma-70 family)
MDQGSVRPTGQIESVETEKKEIGSKKRKNPFERSETWGPCQNDESVTHEKLKQLLQDEDEHHHQSYLRNFVRSCFSDKDTIDDICQQVWAIMLTKVKETIIYKSGFNSYTGKIAYGLILNERRRRTKRINDSIFAVCDSDKPGRETEAYFLPERRRASPEIITLLKEVLNFLEPREQKIFCLDHCGYTDDEIAEELGIQTNNVRVIRYRASRRLAQYIKPRKLYEDTFGR